MDNREYTGPTEDGLHYGDHVRVVRAFKALETVEGRVPTFDGLLVTDFVDTWAVPGRLLRPARGGCMCDVCDRPEPRPAPRQWTREELEALRYWERPAVRCKLEGGGHPTGRVWPDANKVWVEILDGGRPRAEAFSWGLLLEVLNDPHAAPLWFWAKAPAAHGKGV